MEVDLDPYLIILMYHIGSLTMESLNLVKILLEALWPVIISPISSILKFALAVTNVPLVSVTDAVTAKR
jgi:hypothetical protein